MIPRYRYGQELAVVTVTYSPGETLETFLDSLAKATTKATSGPLRVVLADNGSTDGAPERAAHREGVSLLRIGENVGYGSAANRGVVELGPEVGWVVVANPDIEWHPGSLDELLAAGRRWPRAAALGPLIRRPDATVYPSARLLPSLGRGVGHAVLGPVWPGNPWTTAYRQSENSAGDLSAGDLSAGDLSAGDLSAGDLSAGTLCERTAEWLSGSCLLLRRAAFESVGGFDSRYFMYFEDVDLGDRLGRAGWLNVYVPTAEVTHLGGHATSRVCDQMLAEHHHSTYRYLADRHPGALHAPLRLALRAGLAGRSRLMRRAARRV